MDKYGYNRQISAVDILLNNDEKDNQDDLMKFLILMYKINIDWSNKIYGSFFKRCRDNKKIFNVNSIRLSLEKGKRHIYDLWDAVFIKLNDDKTTIGQLVDLMDSKELLNRDFVETIRDDNIYSKVFNVPIHEVIKLEDNNDNPNVSTQHGVKGESHDSVVFVAEESKRYAPRVYMYDFFRVWSNVDFSLDEFEYFYSQYYNFIEKVDIDNKIKDIGYLTQKSNEIIEKFNSNDLFNFLCKDLYIDYIKKPTQKNAKKLFKDNTVKCVLDAYKLFYVGCSRARKNLTILVDEDRITDYKANFIKKVQDVGFKVE